MNTDTVVRLKTDQRTSLNIRKAAKQEFDGLKGGLTDWQFFDILLESYKEQIQAKAS